MRGDCYEFCVMSLYKPAAKCRPNARLRTSTHRALFYRCSHCLPICRYAVSASHVFFFRLNGAGGCAMRMSLLCVRVRSGALCRSYSPAEGVCVQRVSKMMRQPASRQTAASGQTSTTNAENSTLTVRARGGAAMPLPRRFTFAPS